MNGIVTLSDQAAESLSKHNGMLCLYGLKNLSEDAVESLSRHRGSIELDKKLEEKVENLQVSHSKEADEFFCNKSITLNDKNVEKFLDLLKYDFCAFDYVKEIDVVAAGSLSDFRRNDYLELNGLKELSDSAAEILSKHKGDLYLNGLEELSDDVAATLSSHNNELRLSGITELSDTAAKNISKHVGALRLNGLKELSDNAAESLSMKEGRLSLLGITQLSDIALKNLGKRKK